jgi:hypothetical protein
MIRFLGIALATLALVGVAAPARAGTIVYLANLDGPSEDPPVASPGTGFARLTIDDLANTFRIEAWFSGLVAGTTVAHIHGPTAAPLAGNAGVMTPVPSFPGFPVGVTSGTYDATFSMTELSTWRPAFVTANGGTAAGAAAAFLAAVADGKAYLNIHTTQFPGGEIRGFFQPVPEPSSLILGSLAVVGLTAFRLGRRTSKPRA